MNESQSVSIVLQRVCSLLKSVKKIQTFVITQHTTHPNTCTAGFTNCHISLPNTKLKLLKTCKKTTTQAVKASSNATTNRYEQTRAKQKKTRTKYNSSQSVAEFLLSSYPDGCSRKAADVCVCVCCRRTASERMLK